MFVRFFGSRGKAKICCPHTRCLVVSGGQRRKWTMWLQKQIIIALTAAHLTLDGQEQRRYNAHNARYLSSSDLSVFTVRASDKNDGPTTGNVCAPSRNLVQHLSADLLPVACGRQSRSTAAAGECGLARRRFRSAVFPASKTTAACCCQSPARVQN